MQVAHVTEVDSHMVIGGQKTRAFQVKASAAAFKIMSDALYTDKERATVRETVCNAIDANVMAGRADVPVRVRLTDDELTVEDDGPGIPDEKMVDIFCTMFGSTKENQDDQTGGFGLGAKAPFSITDHFTVSSRHGGVMTLYAIHVGDPESNGTPGCKPMMQTPCDGTGLSVSIPLAGPDMRRKIEAALREVVREGGMNVTLNGEKVEANDWTELKRHGFALAYINSQWGRRANLQLLYANVLYPVSSHPEIAGYVTKLEHYGANRAIILYAPPSSISVVPSREALSYNEKTVATMKAILKRACNAIAPMAAHYKKKEIADALKEATRNNLSNERVRIPARDNVSEVLAGAEAVARAYARHLIDIRGIPVPDRAKGYLAVVKGRKRNLRIMAGGHTREMSFDLDRYQWIRRSIVRAAAVAGQEGFLFTRENGDRSNVYHALNKPSKPRSYRRGHREGEYKPILTITTARGLLDQDSPQFFLINQRIKPAQIAAVKARAEKLGLEVKVVLPKPKVVQKAKEPFGPPCPPRYYPLQFDGDMTDRDKQVGYDSANAKTIRLRTRRFIGACKFQGDAVAFFGVRGSTFNHDPAFWGNKIPNATTAQRLIKDNIGRVVMATSRGDVEALLAGNVRRLEEIVLEKLKARVKRPKPYEAFYAQLAMAVADETDDRHKINKFGLNSVARTMMLFSRRFAHAAVREPFKPNKDRDEAYTWWMIARSVFHRRWLIDANVDQAETETITRLYEEYRELAMPLEARHSGQRGAWVNTEHLGLFEPFTYTGFGGLTTEQRADFLDFAEELGRRHAARKEKAR